MSAADLVLAVLVLALTAYALLGGADFGGGFWDLFAGAGERAMARRRLIEHTLGPVWEANHVWLIFALVLLWSGFPPVFAAVTSTAYIPLTLAALGIIGRGAGFAFRKVSTEYGHQRLYGAAFAFSSVATPFFLGAVAGGIASGRIPPSIAGGDPLTSWWNPTSITTGVLAVGTGAYLAAVFLTRDAQHHAPDLLLDFRRYAARAGITVGAIAAVGLLIVHLDSPGLSAALGHGPALALILLSIASGLASLILLYTGRYLAVRVTASLAAAAVLWAWGAAQYPVLLPPDTTVERAAADPAVLRALLGVTVLGALILLPSLWWLFALFQRKSPPRTAQIRHDRPDAPPGRG
jgi:cytochrome d ubiquinol oxidase subunit II